jgi:hypothetical protein
MKFATLVINIDVAKGAPILKTIGEALALAKLIDDEVRIEHNGVPIVAKPTDSNAAVVNRYTQAKTKLKPEESQIEVWGRQ